jgi:hypothetical protein
VPNLLPQTTITTAVSATAGPWIAFNSRIEDSAPCHLAVQANFVYNSGGTNVTAYVQTSFDGGATAVDIACFQFTTSSARKAGCDPATSVGPNPESHSG